MKKYNISFQNLKLSGKITMNFTC